MDVRDQANRGDRRIRRNPPKGWKDRRCGRRPSLSHVAFDL